MNQLAKSKAKKWREKSIREGKRNPKENRSPFIYADMITRRTKTKKDHLYQCKHKNLPSRSGNDGSFYFLSRLNSSKKTSGFSSLT